MKRKTKFLPVLLSALLVSAVLFTACSNESENPASEEENATDNSAFESSDYALPTDLPSTANGNMGEVKLESGDLYATISVKDYGDITVKLFADIAPTAVYNFAKAAESGYYDGKNFHRIIADFMAQGGSLNGDGASDLSGVSYGIEVSPNARHFYGAIAMGKTGLGDCGLQFYLVNNKKPDEFTRIKEQLSYLKDNVEQLEGIMTEIADYIAENGDESVDPNAVKQYEEQLKYYTNLVDYVENAAPEVAEKYADGGVPFLDGGYTVFGQTIEGFEVIDKISAVEVTGTGDEISTPVTEILIDKVVIKRK